VIKKPRELGGPGPLGGWCAGGLVRQKKEKEKERKKKERKKERRNRLLIFFRCDGVQFGRTFLIFRCLCCLLHQGAFIIQRRYTG
jgi:hypothetical protein